MEAIRSEESGKSGSGILILLQEGFKSYCNSGLSLATQTADASMGTGSIPASRSVSRTNRCRRFPSSRATSAIAANSDLNAVRGATYCAVYAYSLHAIGERLTLSIWTNLRFPFRRYVLSMRIGSPG
jgi:hypothetical protein